MYGGGPAKGGFATSLPADEQARSRTRGHLIFVTLALRFERVSDNMRLSQVKGFPSGEQV